MESLKNEFSERKMLPPSLTKQRSAFDGSGATTNYTVNKPPSIRRYYRDSSVGSKLRYNFSKENIIRESTLTNSSQK